MDHNSLEDALSNERPLRGVRHSRSLWRLALRRCKFLVRLQVGTAREPSLCHNGSLALVVQT